MDDALQRWVGRRQTARDVCDPRRVADLAATLDLERAPAPGERLPPGWHWMFFQPMVGASRLGPDGHAARGEFLPPVALPRRMWAGGRLAFRAPIAVGAALVRESEIVSVASKSGRSGAMVFVTVRHRIAADGVDAIEEEHDIVYRDVPKAEEAAAAEPAPADGAWRRALTPDPVLLFRYSALTANGHRIHYDHPYVTLVEGYRGLIVHGPLTATLLMALAESASGRRLARFAFRARAPLFANEPLVIAGRLVGADGAEVWAIAPDGGLAMRGEGDFAPS
jgi:3-methylfumaryl-CoA hydratase